MREYLVGGREVAKRVAAIIEGSNLPTDIALNEFSRFAAARVEDHLSTYSDKVCVDSFDREIEGWGYSGRSLVNPIDEDDASIRRQGPTTRIELARLLPLKDSRVPEPMILSCRQYDPTNQQIHQGVLVNPKRGDSSGASLTSFGILSEYPFTNFDLRDRLRCAVSEQYLGAG